MKDLMVRCKKDRIKEYIQDWIDAQSFSWEAFESVLIQAGLSLPVEITHYNTLSNSFECSANNGDFTITLFFGNYFDDSFAIEVSGDEETCKYEIEHYPSVDFEIMPKLFLVKRQLRLDGINYSLEYGFNANEPMSYEISDGLCTLTGAGWEYKQKGIIIVFNKLFKSYTVQLKGKRKALKTLDLNRIIEKAAKRAAKLKKKINGILSV